jgi:type III secretion protein S
MTPASVIDLSYQALMLVLMLSMPAVAVSAVVGVVVGLLQAVTQIQDQSIAYAAKLIAVTVATVLSARWMGGELYQFGENLLHMLPALAHK